MPEPKTGCRHQASTIPGLSKSTMRTVFSKILPVIRNKYLLSLVVFSVWMVFFDDRDVITTHFRYKSELNKLEESKEYYQQQIDQTRTELAKLQTDPDLLEKYARERYRMKKDNEDLFIIEDKVTE
jgi:cell division protein FtsB